jgi:hypothetical protein
MHLFINTNFRFSNKIINEFTQFNNTNLEIDITQIYCKNINKVIELINTNNDDLKSKIKTMLNNYNSRITPNIELFIKLCILYFNGGIIINNNIFIKNIKLILDIYTNNDICVIKSCIEDKIFEGIVIAKKGENKILNIINTFLNEPETTDINKLILNVVNQNINCKLLNEEIILNKSNIYSEGEVIAEHFYKSEIIIENIKIPKNNFKDISSIKIGITINFPSNLKDFYSNGIRQNCLYLYEVLKNINYDVKLILDNETNISVLNEIDFYNFEYINVNDIFNYDFDLIFSMGFSFPIHLFNGLKNIGVKIVYYMCGNNYLIDSEKILYNQHKTKTLNYVDDKCYDQVWIIPQMYNQNKYYFEILNKSKCIQVPFIWSPMSIKFMTKILNLDNDSSLFYKKKEAKIGIFEPNMSVMKWSLPCVLIAEHTHRTYKNVSHVYITNLNKNKENDINDFNMEEFNNICKCLDLFKERKMSSESRFITLEFMSKYCDIVISHQWENPLNYLYLDLAWMGWPILHNAYLCKDVGYYYEGFNYHEGSEKLNYILTNHDANTKEYLNQNRKTIETYIPSNKLLQNKYKNLIEALFTNS